MLHVTIKEELMYTYKNTMRQVTDKKKLHDQ